MLTLNTKPAFCVLCSFDAPDRRRERGRERQLYQRKRRALRRDYQWRYLRFRNRIQYYDKRQRERAAQLLASLWWPGESLTELNGILYGITGGGTCDGGTVFSITLSGTVKRCTTSAKPLRLLASNTS